MTMSMFKLTIYGVVLVILALAFQLVQTTKASQLQLIVVTNTQDSGVGSLREAIETANSNPGADTISFNIPTSDPGYVAYQDDGNAGTFDPTAFTAPDTDPAADPDSPRWWLIGVLGSDVALPSIADDNTTLDGTTQTTNQGDSNPYGPEIQIANQSSDLYYTGLRVEGDMNEIRGLSVTGFATQVFITGDNNQVMGNYVGTEPSGRATRSSQLLGVYVYFFSTNNIIGSSDPLDRNVINGNVNGNVYLEGDYTEITGNYMGVSADGTMQVGASWVNINLSYVTSTQIINNVVGGSLIAMYRANETIIEENIIGSDPTGSLDFGSYWQGIRIRHSTNTRIGPNNLIHFSNDDGIWIQDDDSLGNIITQNSISYNGDDGIFLFDGGNNEMPAPIVSYAFANVVGGIAEPLATIEIFSDEADEGAIYEATVTADEEGYFIWYGSAMGPNVTATATDGVGNTSPFSVPLALQGGATFYYLPIIALP